METKVLFAERLKYFRNEKGWSQEQLGKQIGVTRQNICDWENGKSETNFENLIKLSRIFEITVDLLIGNCDF